MSEMETVTTQAAPKAEAVRENSHLLQRKCACSGSSGFGAPCSKCADDEKKLRRKAGGSHQHSSQVPGIVNEVLSSAGRPLDPVPRELCWCEPPAFLRSFFSSSA